MAKSWLSFFTQTALTIGVIISTLVTLILITLPSTYHAEEPALISEDDFSEDDKQNKTSGYGYYSQKCGSSKAIPPATSVVVLVLGDIGRSPRMQYHAASIAAHGGRVDLVGYVESDVLPEIQASKLINIVPLAPIPERLRTSSKALFPLIAPLKVLFQVWILYHTLAYRIKPSKFMLVQNPPSIPTLLIAQIICFIRHTRLIIDWHNLGHTILALKLGPRHPLVKLSEIYETYVARFAHGHFAVSQAMARLLKSRYNINASPLYDRPARQFQPLSPSQRSRVLSRLPETAKRAPALEAGKWRLIVSPTSWTPDEDFSILLDALVAYSATVSMSHSYPHILAIITGKGPLKRHYLDRIETLRKQHKLENVSIHTAWLSMDDYAALLGAADLGVSLHMSSSGVDLPMKVVDMFGAGLPVVGWDGFESWPELVKEGVNGRGFKDANDLERLLEELFGDRGTAGLKKIKMGAMEESKTRWEDEWSKAARTFEIEM